MKRSLSELKFIYDPFERKNTILQLRPREARETSEPFLPVVMCIYALLKQVQFTAFDDCGTAKGIPSSGQNDRVLIDITINNFSYQKINICALRKAFRQPIHYLQFNSHEKCKYLALSQRCLLNFLTTPHFLIDAMSSSLCANVIRAHYSPLLTTEVS